MPFKAPLPVQGNLQLVSQLSRAEWTARKIPAANMQRGNFPFAVIGAEHNLLRFVILLNIYFPEFHSALFQKHLHAPAIRAPSCTVDCYRFQPLFFCHSLL
jgi:hypothetical protein